MNRAGGNNQCLSPTIIDTLTSSAKAILRSFNLVIAESPDCYFGIRPNQLCIWPNRVCRISWLPVWWQDLEKVRTDEDSGSQFTVPDIPELPHIDDDSCRRYGRNWSLAERSAKLRSDQRWSCALGARQNSFLVFKRDDCRQSGIFLSSIAGFVIVRLLP